MKPEIASLHDRMAQGGDWRTFRDEIAARHSEATTEEEYVALLEAHRKLVAVAKFAYDDQTYTKLLSITAAEYRMFLNKEAMQDGLINPVLLERVTRREVEAGRLDPDDEFRTMSVAGAAVLGDSAGICPQERNMARDEFEEAKKQSAEIAKLLKEGNLTAEERQKLETLQTQLSGALLSPWLPFGGGRRSIIIVLFLVGASGLVQGNGYFLFAWLFLLFFSPRVVGEVAYALGRFMAGLNGRA